MTTEVLKYGGSSLAGGGRLEAVAGDIAVLARAGVSIAGQGEGDMDHA